MKYMFLPLKRYFEFNGRSRRKELWLFSLLVGKIYAFSREIPVLGSILSLVFIIPSWTVGVRRMHDVGKSGWFFLIPIYSFYLCCIDGEYGTNQYGESQKIQD